MSVSSSALVSKLRQDDIEAAQDDFLDFVLEVDESYKVAWFNQILCDRLTRLQKEKGKRIMIWVPPQHGKSLLVSKYYPAWVLGKNKEAQIIQSSYGQGLATDFCRATNALMQTDTYAEIFPESAFSQERKEEYKDAKNQSNFFEVNPNRGSMYSVGVGGPTTGKTANPLFIIDDPIKDQQQADSETYRKTIIEWFAAVAESRCHPDANIILMHTRWHKQDLCGHLLENYGDEWEVISLPALAYKEDHKFRHPEDPRQEGETIWPDGRHTQEQMEAVKARTPTRIWNALWNQNPTIEGGSIIKDAWLRFYDFLPIRGEKSEQPRWVSSWDLTFKDKKASKTGKVDDVAGLVIVKIGAFYYIHDSFCDKVGFTDSCKAINSFKERNPKCTTHWIEDKANGPAVIETMRKKVAGIVEVEPQGKKEERLEACEPLFRSGNIFISNSLRHKKKLIDQLTEFPNSDYDDLVDALTQGILQLEMKIGVIDKLKKMGTKK